MDINVSNPVSIAKEQLSAYIESILSVVTDEILLLGFINFLLEQGKKYEAENLSQQRSYGRKF